MTTKRWAGETPYDEAFMFSPDAAEDEETLPGAYRAAMNSPEVRALYEAVRSMRLIELMGTPGAREALAAYEKGLVDEPSLKCPDCHIPLHAAGGYTVSAPPLIRGVITDLSCPKCKRKFEKL